MTRMLCSSVLASLLLIGTSSCSLFDSSSDNMSVTDLDNQSASGDAQLTGLEDIDAESELLAESGALELGDEVAEGDAAIPSEDDFADPFAEQASGEVAEDFIEEGEDLSFGGDFGEDFSEEFAAAEISTTDENQVDPQLADDELDEFNEFADTANTTAADQQPGFEDEFAFEAEPVIDEPAPAEPIVDVPEGEVASLGPLPGATEITNLQYKAFANGGTVVIETSNPVEFQKSVDPELNQIVIEVPGAFLPERFKRPYITKDFKQDIATINAYADDTGSARFVIQLKRPIQPIISQEGNSILVMTSDNAMMQASSGMGSGVMTGGAPEQSLDQLVSQNQMQVEPYVSNSVGVTASSNGVIRNANVNASLKTAFGGNEKSGMNLNGENFVGEPISVEVVDTDVRQIIEVIAEKSGVNLVMDDDVDGKASLRLRDVPWDQALLVLLRSKGLGYVKQGNVLRIAKQDTLSKEAQAVSAQIKSEKEAKLLSGGIKVKYIPVSYANVDELAKKLADFTSKEGKIAFDNRTSSLVITDYGEFIDRILELVKALDTPPMQVEIEAKLVEAREDFIRETGINWDMNGGDFPLGSQTGRLNADFDPNAGTDGLTMDLSVGTFDIFGDLTAALNMFEEQNKIKVLSQPRIVTMNKVEATIEQTTQIPVSVVIPTAGATPLPSVEFKDLILGLKVNPQITFKGDVILQVELKREFAGAEASNGNREINKRNAKTTVMVKNGKTAVIGGIYQLDDGNLENGIPLLKDIPIIGYLFKSSRMEKIKNELLLFLKPKILKEIEGPMVSKTGAPGDNYDPFQELSIDEGAAEKTESQFGTPAAEEDLFDEEFDKMDDTSVEETFSL